MTHQPHGDIYAPTVSDVREPLESHRRAIADLTDTRPDLWAVDCPQCRAIHGTLHDGSPRPAQPHYFTSRAAAELAVNIGVEVRF